MNEEMSWTQKILRGTIGAIVIPVVIAVIVLPYCVPPPKMSLEISDHVELGNDLEFTLQIYGWQSNYFIEYVWCNSDKSNSACDGKNGLFERIDIVRNYGPMYYYATRFGRLPFPRMVSYKFKVPLRDVAASGKLGRGRFTGQVHVSWSYETPQEDPSARNGSRSRLKAHKFAHVSNTFPLSIQVQ